MTLEGGGKSTIHLGLKHFRRIKQENEVLLSILIVNYKTPDLTLNCIASIYEHAPKFPFEIISGQ